MSSTKSFDKLASPVDDKKTRQKFLKNSQKTRKLSLIGIAHKRKDTLSKLREEPRRISFPISKSKEFDFKHSTDSLIKALNDFSFDFYSQVAEGISKNIIFSPLSAYKVLQSMYMSSSGNPETELARILRIKTNTDQVLNKDQLAKSFSLLLKSFVDNFTISNCSNSKENFLKPEYIDQLKINSTLEVNENNDQLHQKFLALSEHFTKESEFTDEIFMILSNNTEFKSDWKTSFIPTTSPGCFTKANDEKLPVEIMKIPNSKLLYAKNPLKMPLKICEFPFMNESYAFTVLLPDKGSIEAIEKDLDSKTFSDLINSMRPKSVSTIFPKFLITDQFDLNKIIEKMGGEDIFTQLPYSISIQNSFFQSQINIDYHSAAATANTHFILGKSENVDESSEPILTEHPTEEFKCDKPFVFFLRERNTGLILFMGKLMVPTILKEKKRLTLD